MTSSPRWLDSSEMTAWVAFLEATNLMQRELERQVREDGGITHAQYGVLARLSEAPDGRRRMTELADALVVSKSGLTYQVTQLERAGLVTRCPSPDDDRCVLACLTDEGWAVLERTAPGHVRVVREGLLDALDAHELRALGESLGKVRDRLRDRT